MVWNWGDGDWSKISFILVFQLAQFYLQDTYSLWTLKPNQNGRNWTPPSIHAVWFPHLRILSTVQHAGFSSTMGGCSTMFSILQWVTRTTQRQNHDPWEAWVFMRNGECYCPSWHLILGMTSQMKTELSFWSQNHTLSPFWATLHPDNNPSIYQLQLCNHPLPTQGFPNHSAYSKTLQTCVRVGWKTQTRGAWTSTQEQVMSSLQCQ